MVGAAALATTVGAQNPPVRRAADVHGLERLAANVLARRVAVLRGHDARSHGDGGEETHLERREIQDVAGGIA